MCHWRPWQGVLVFVATRIFHGRDLAAIARF
jgi:hypothetical protein